MHGIDKIFARLEVDGEAVLMLMLSRSGAISRMGDGSGEPEFQHLVKGHSEEGLLEKFLKKMDEGLLEYAGRYELPEPRGQRCVLTLSLEGENLDTGFEFTFGSESEGPPAEILELVEYAMKLTDAWYEEELEKRV